MVRPDLETSTLPAHGMQRSSDDPMKRVNGHGIQVRDEVEIQDDS